jgi:hypothetical protein
MKGVELKLDALGKFAQERTQRAAGRRVGGADPKRHDTDIKKSSARFVTGVMDR